MVVMIHVCLCDVHHSKAGLCFHGSCSGGAGPPGVDTAARCRQEHAGLVLIVF